MSAIHVPKRMRFVLDSEQLNTLFQKRNECFQRALVKALTDFTKENDIQKYITIEFKKFNTSDNTIEEVRCCDRVIGTTYLSRTDHNHQEALWAFFPDAFPAIKKYVKELKKRL